MPETSLGSMFSLQELVVKRTNAESEEELYRTVYRLLVEQWGGVARMRSIFDYFMLPDDVSPEQAIKKLEGENCGALLIVRH